MSIKKLIVGMVLALSASAPFAESITSTIVLTPGGAGSYTAGFDISHMFAGDFTDTFSILPELSGDVSSSLITIGFVPGANINFVSASVNGVFFDLSPTGAGEFGFLSVVALQAPLTLTVNGVAGVGLPTGNPIAASYSGTFNLTGAQEIPEPATVALLGLALFGFGAARKRKQ